MSLGISKLHKQSIIQHQIYRIYSTIFGGVELTIGASWQTDFYL